MIIFDSRNVCRQGETKDAFTVYRQKRGEQVSGGEKYIYILNRTPPGPRETPTWALGANDTTRYARTLRCDARTLRKAGLSQRVELVRVSVCGCHFIVAKVQSMLNNIGGPSTRTFFKLTKRWRSDSLSVLYWGVFRVEECPELIWHLHRNVGAVVVFTLNRSFYPTTSSGNPSALPDSSSKRDTNYVVTDRKNKKSNVAKEQREPNQVLLLVNGISTSYFEVLV